MKIPKKTSTNGEFRKKMVGCAIICEYNPFQRGHERQIANLHAQFPDACVTAVLAGNFVQRGEPAVLSKYKRAEAAVRCGADLVLELPFPWSAQGASYYANAAVSLADSAGCSLLCFGSETGDLDRLVTAAGRMDSDGFDDAVRASEAKNMQSGVSHIAAVREVYRELYGEELPLGSNDTLGIEYLRAINKNGYPIKTVCMKREGGYSATLAREFYLAGDLDSLAENVPERLLDFYRVNPPVNDVIFGQTVLAMLRLSDPQEISQYADLGGGIAERLCSAAKNAKNYDEFKRLAATKKYTDSRLRRAALAAVMRVTKEMLDSRPAYTVLLAADRTGTAYLRAMKKKSDLCVLTHPYEGQRLKGTAGEQFRISTFADTLWAHSAREAPADQIKAKPYIQK